MSFVTISSLSWICDAKASRTRLQYRYLVKAAILPSRTMQPRSYMADCLQFVREVQQEILDHMCDRQLRDLSSAQLYDASPAQLLQRGLPFPVRDLQAPLGCVHVILQEGKERWEGALVAGQRELLLLVVDAHTDGSFPVVIGQGEKDVLLPAVTDKVAAQRGAAEHAVGLLHSQRAPVEAAALKLGGCVSDDVAVLLGGERWEMS